ncbi:unnamed protein product [Medioppia subpectinata]|uniref:non-specific serine/threonine protein kinase n=1 Tax=Medioppia subpectinata TaxID=1979941 RepID=A0A7R9KX58_9ACAR|nr:unnamed protein product [Medioppia subpectinata]CAG2110419.1 unnamed protein product [Medioppia subpectinata]
MVSIEPNTIVSNTIDVTLYDEGHTAASVIVERLEQTTEFAAYKVDHPTDKTNSQYNVTAPATYYDYTNYSVKPGNIDKYMITSVLGKGKYSEVFKGIERTYSDKKDSLQERSSRITTNISSTVVIKVLKPIKPSKIFREILVLDNLNHKNIIKLKDVVSDKSTRTHSLVFSYLSHQDSYTAFESCDLQECIEYSRQILEGLAYAHSKGIMHRDIKPGNIIISDDLGNISNTKTFLKIIDWGLAEFYHPKKDYSVRVASKFYKSPELLLDYPYYDYSLDIWAFGCILAEMITKKQPFFYTKRKSSVLINTEISKCQIKTPPNSTSSQNNLVNHQTIDKKVFRNEHLSSNVHNTSMSTLKKNDSILGEIVRILGKEDLRNYIAKYEININKNNEAIIDRISGCEKRRDLREFVENETFLSIVEVLESIFVYDHRDRPTAEELLRHKIFQ